MTIKEFGITIRSTETAGVWKVSRKGQKSLLLVQPVFEVNIGILPTIDQALNLLNKR